MARILTTVALLVVALALSGCGMPYGYSGLEGVLGALGGYGTGYGGGYGYAPGYGGYAGAQSCGGMGMPIPVPVDPGYSGGYVQQPYYQGQTYQGQPYPNGTYPEQYANNQYRHRHHDPNQQPTDPNNLTTDPTQTGNQPWSNWTNHRRSGQTPTQTGTPTDPTGTTGATGTIGTTEIPGTTGTTRTTGQMRSQQQNQLNNANNRIANTNQSPRGQWPGTSQYGNPNQRTPGMLSSPQMSQGSRMGYNQSMGGYRAPMTQAPMQPRTGAPMMSAPRVSAPAPRAAVGANRPPQMGTMRGPGQ